MRQGEMDFDIMRNSWAMTKNEIIPDSLAGDKHWFISAVEITYQREYDEEEVIRKNKIVLGGMVLSERLQISPRNKTVAVKQFIFAHP